MKDRSPVRDTRYGGRAGHVGVLTQPRRVQRTRVKGKPGMPPGAVYVGRPSKWGNPYDGDRYSAVELFTVLLAMLRARFPLADDVGRPMTYPSDDEIRAELAGRDLACWCPLPEPGQPDICHAALLLEIANGDPDA